MMPTNSHSPFKTGLSIFGVFVLFGGIFMAVMAAQNSTEQRSRAYDGGYNDSGYNDGGYDRGGYDGGSYDGGGHNGGGSYPTNTSTTTSPTSDIIIDNRSASIVGNWETGTSASGHYGSDYRFAGPGSGSSYLQYTPNITKAGQYDVYEWHSQGTNRTTAGKIVVSYSGGSKFISMNQQINGGKWNLLGRFTFAQGSSGNVRITNGFSGYSDIVMIADAVKYVYTGTTATVPTPTKVLTYLPTPTNIPPTSVPNVPQPTATSGPSAGPTAKPEPTPTDLPGFESTPEPTNIPEPTEILQPTPTPEADATILALTLGLHGIGNAGENLNATAVGNEAPQRVERMILVEVYDIYNKFVTSHEQSVVYDDSSGMFEGAINLGRIDTGAYTVKVKTDQYLSTRVSREYLANGQMNDLPTMVLRGGDVNSDDKINILDYNVLTGCYSDLLPAIDCTDDNTIHADLNDDGKVNQFDYNFFLRELSSNR
jgi:hypothetical protein